MKKIDNKVKKKESIMAGLNTWPWYRLVLFTAIIYFLVDLMIGLFRGKEMEFDQILMRSLIFGFIWTGVIKYFNKTDHARKK